MNYTKISEVLTAVDEKFSTPDKWNKKRFALNIQGNTCSTISDEAVSYCLLGAICYVTGIKTFEIQYEDISHVHRIANSTVKFLSNLIVSNPSWNEHTRLFTWNDEDERTFQEVKYLLKLAKEKAKHEGL